MLETTINDRQEAMADMYAYAFTHIKASYTAVHINGRRYRMQLAEADMHMGDLLAYGDMTDPLIARYFR